MGKRQILGYIGSIVLFIGTFMPVVSAPIIGSLNYFQNGKADGVIIIVLAAMALFSTIIKDYGKLWIPGVGSLGILIFTFINLRKRISEIQEQMNIELYGNPFRGLAAIAVQSIQLQWGWGFLIIGALLLIAAALIKEENEVITQKSNDESVGDD